MSRSDKADARARDRAKYLSDQTGKQVEFVPPEMWQASDVFVQQVPGVHQWTVIAVYTVSDDEALDSYAGGDRTPLLDLEHLATMQGPGCVICEEPWTKVHNKPCTGEPVSASR